MRKGGRRLAERRTRAAAACVGVILAALAAPAAAQDHSRVYSAQELAADGPRLEKRARELYRIVLEQVLTPAETARLGNVLLEFPEPYEGDHVLEFYTYEDGDRDVVSMPIMSLKATEDLATAVQWLNQQRYTLGTIDLYFTMMRREDPSDFAGGAYPALLPALGVPADAYKSLGGNDTSMRNDAWAFALLHELGHVALDHKDYAELTTEEARRDERAADQFALDALARIGGRPPAGAYFMLQAQAYSLPHRGQFDSEAAWLKFMDEENVHPVTSDRLQAIGEHVLRTARGKSGVDREAWTYIGERMIAFSRDLANLELQQCITRAGEQATLADLKPRREPPEALMRKACL
ncbi:MAG: hypothetical protein AAGM38_03680 [Pseudomonadota bacterium]